MYKWCYSQRPPVALGTLTSARHVVTLPLWKKSNDFLHHIVTNRFPPFWQRHSSLQFIPYLPPGQAWSHSGPMYPGRHVHEPVTGSHVAPFWHGQSRSQSGPHLPGSQTEKGNIYIAYNKWNKIRSGQYSYISSSPFLQSPAHSDTCLGPHTCHADTCHYRQGGTWTHPHSAHIRHSTPAPRAACLEAETHMTG